MKTLTKVLLHKLGRSGHAVEISVQVMIGKRSGHLLLTHLGVEHPLSEVLTLLVGFLIDVHLVDSTAIGKRVGSFVFLNRNLLHQLGGVVGLHQLFHCALLLAVGGNILWSHLLWMQFLAVNLGGKEPVLRILVRLVGMGMSDLATIDSHHLRLTVLLLTLQLFLLGSFSGRLLLAVGLLLSLGG